MKTKAFLRLMLLSVLLLSGWSSVLAQERYFDQLDDFLARYHQPGGLIDYSHISKVDETLDSLYDAVGTIDLTDSSESFAKAFYINAYNIIVIKQVTAFYPIKGPFDIQGFFDNIQSVVAGREMTLDVLEKQVILPRFKDPRIHFALVCAARSCPVIDEKAYRPETIEDELDRVAQQVCNNDFYVKLKGKTLYLSKIFDWYAAEFTGGQTIVAYLNQYREEPIPEGVKIRYNDYDWSLNDSVQ